MRIPAPQPSLLCPHTLTSVCIIGSREHSLNDQVPLPFEEDIKPAFLCASGNSTDSTQHSPEASLCGVSLTPTLQGLCLAGVGTSAQRARGGLQSHSEPALLFQSSGVEAELCIGKPHRLGEPRERPGSGGGSQASFCSFSKDFIIYLVLVCVCVCHRTCVEITGQLTRVLSLFSPCGS